MMIAYPMTAALFALLLAAPPPRAAAPPPANEATPSLAGPAVPRGMDDLRYLTGRYRPADHPRDFRRLPKALTDGRDHWLRRDAAAAFEEMAEAAQADGVALKVISSFRGYDYQMGIFRRKVKGKPTAEKVRRYLEFSALPGTSRHHWGTEVDLNNLSNAHFEKGEGKRIHDWLLAHAADFGFAKVYTAGRAHGHQPEAWHWSYVPISIPLYRIYNEHFEKGELTDAMLGPFAGELDVVRVYVRGIAPKLRGEAAGKGAGAAPPADPPRKPARR